MGKHRTALSWELLHRISGVRDHDCLGHVPGCSSGWHLWPDCCGTGAGQMLFHPGRGSGCCGSWLSTGKILQVWNWAGVHSGRGGWALWGQDLRAVRKSQWKSMPVLSVKWALKLSDVSGFRFSEFDFSVIKIHPLLCFLTTHSSCSHNRPHCFLCKKCMVLTGEEILCLNKSNRTIW